MLIDKVSKTPARWGIGGADSAINPVVGEDLERSGSTRMLLWLERVGDSWDDGRSRADWAGQTM